MRPSDPCVRQPPAVVVGVCAHGLAVVRALARQGVDVHVLEANGDLPGMRTRYARTHLCDDINRAGLTSALRRLGDELNARSPGRTPVLMVTNDNMVRQLADDWPALRDSYRLSWGNCADDVRRLLLKPAHEVHSRQVGLNYPRTCVVHSHDDLAVVDADVGFPAIVKPARPLSSFKARRVDSTQGLVELLNLHAGDLPFVVQHWVPGGDERISFCALYLDRGRILARFDGRKLRSWPMGHTTVAEPHVDDEVFEQTRRFFAPLALSGPVSLELKRDDEGRLWVIEPTVGRTDFWLGLCVANGVNLPYAEYRHQVGLDFAQSAQTAEWTWLNTDRDPAALPWYVARCLVGAARLRAVAFPYSGADDLRPFLHAMGGAVADYSAAGLRKLVRAARSGVGQARNGRATR